MLDTETVIAECAHVTLSARRSLGARYSLTGQSTVGKLGGAIPYETLAIVILAVHVGLGRWVTTTIFI